MAKPRHISKAIESNQEKRVGMRRRSDVTHLPRKQQRELIAFTLQIQELVEAENRNELSDDALQAAAIELQKKPWEIRAAIRQFRTYHATYPDQHAANAFTPTIRNKGSEVEPAEALAESAPGSTKRLPTKGIALALVPEPEQSRIKAFAERIADLNQLKRDLGRVPRGERERVAAEFGSTPDWISKSMQIQQAYIAAYPDEPFYHAHTPRQVGRPKGRTTPDEVREAIELARINKHWLSQNGAGGYDELNSVIEKKLIHSLIVQHFGQIHSESATYRIIRDYEELRAARIQAADEDIGILQTHLPTISNKARGPGDRAQFDARPLSVVVDNDGVLCTVHVMLMFDDATGYLAGWELIPAKRLDDEGEIHRQTFKDQLSRATVARGVMSVGRFRIFYADHGYEAFKNYMAFMVAAGEDPTLLIHSRVARPRGRGTVERGGQLVDGFLKTRPYYVRERDFRRSRTKKRSEIRTFTQFREDFAAYAHHWNHDPAPGGGPSRRDLLKQGPSFFLTPPSPENLAMFAMSQRREQRDPRRDGDTWFWLDSRGYEAYRRDAAIYKQFADLSSRGGKIDVVVFDFGTQPEDRIVLFSLDGERTWELAVPAGTREISGRRHSEILIEVERQLVREDAENLDAFFQKIILGSTKGRLVLNGLARERHFYHHEPHVPEPSSEASFVPTNEERSSPEEAETGGTSEEPLAQASDDHGVTATADTSDALQNPEHSSPSSRTARVGRPRKSRAPAKMERAPNTNTQATTGHGDSNAPLATSEPSTPTTPSKAPNILEQLRKRQQPGDR